MKKLILVIFVIGISWSTYSQESYMNLLLNYTPTKFNFGKDNGRVKDFRNGLRGFQGGFSFQLGINQHFSVVPEIYYFRKGVELEQGNPLTINETKVKLNTVELPILFRYHFLGFFLNAGPSLAVNVSGKMEWEDTNLVQERSMKLRFDGSPNAFKRWDMGIQMGLGKEFKLKNRSRISIEGRYHYGLTNIANPWEAYNRYFYVNVLFSKAWKKNPLSVRK